MWVIPYANWTKYTMLQKCRFSFKSISLYDRPVLRRCAVINPIPPSGVTICHTSWTAYRIGALYEKGA